MLRGGDDSSAADGGGDLSMTGRCTAQASGNGAPRRAQAGIRCGAEHSRRPAGPAVLAPLKQRSAVGLPLGMALL